MSIKTTKEAELKDKIKIEYKIDKNSPPSQENKIKDTSDDTIKKMLKISFICFLFLIAELIGGVIANSLAILSDAAHLSSDLSGFIISLFSLYIGKKNPNNKYTFGYYRAEVIGALGSVITIWVLTGILLKEAFDRLINPSEINAGVMLITSIFGLICNLAMFKVLHSGHHHHHDCSHGNKNDNILNIFDDFKDSLENSKENSVIIEEDSPSHLTILNNDEENKNQENR
jgi:cation diffusion facilitator family transporter